MPTPATPHLFEAPSGTLFICEKDSILIVSRDGAQALIPLVDFLRFLLHLSLCQATCAVNLLQRCLQACAVIAVDPDP